MDPHEVNQARWAGADESLADEYEHHEDRPVEPLLLERYRTELSARVLEIGVGGGRLTEQLCAISGEVTGIDLAATMVERCRRRFPQATFHEADLRDLSRFPDGAFDALLAGFNVLDVLGHEERAAALREWRRVLVAGALLVVSSHNLHHADRIPSPARILARHPRHVLLNLRRRGLRMANARRLAPLERHEGSWAIVVDEAHDHSLLHYYATRDEVARQLAAHGFALTEVLDLDGRVVAAGERAAACPELHYVARAA